MIERSLVKVWWESRSLSAEVLTINILMIIMILITIISSPGWHLEVFWRRDSNNYVIVKPETDARNLNT